MESNEVKTKFKETVRSTKELLNALKKATRNRLMDTAPRVANYLDKSFDQASKGMTDAMESLDKRTVHEQRELLIAYGSFLKKQLEIVEDRLATLEQERQDNVPAPA